MGVKAGICLVFLIYRTDQQGENTDRTLSLYPMDRHFLMSYFVIFCFSENLILQDQGDDSVGEGKHYPAWLLSLSPSTHRVEENKWAGEVVPSPHTDTFALKHMHMHMYSGVWGGRK